jgi:hypothetical protein
MNHVLKMNRTEFVDLNFFYNFYSLHFSVGRIQLIASPSEKLKRGPKFPWGPKLGALTVMLSWNNLMLVKCVQNICKSCSWIMQIMFMNHAIHVHESCKSCSWIMWIMFMLVNIGKSCVVSELSRQRIVKVELSSVNLMLIQVNLMFSQVNLMSSQVNYWSSEFNVHSCQVIVKLNQVVVYSDKIIVYSS